MWRKATAGVEAQAPVSPLAWWRTHPLGNLSALDAAALQSSIARIALHGEPRWPEARSGNVAAAVGILLGLLKAGRTSEAALDLAGAALLVAAIGDDATAVLVLGHARRFVEAGTAGRGRAPASSPDPVSAIAALQAQLSAAVEE